jgi:hypothetical protein
MDLEAHFQNLASLNINPDEIENEQHAKAFNSLFAIVEILSEENIAQKEQIQMLQDEINLLKGEQTKPNIRDSKKNDDISSEDERKQREPQKNRESNCAGAPRSKLAGYVRASTQNSVKESDNHNLA